MVVIEFFIKIFFKLVTIPGIDTQKYFFFSFEIAFFMRNSDSAGQKVLWELKSIKYLKKLRRAVSAILII